MDLPLIWAMLISVAIVVYVLLDGMDLGIGMLTGLAKSDEERNMMTATIEPVWDGNETWLVLGGGGLFAAFPLAYAILMPALYLPVLIMLAALIFRGVAFEFRHKAVRKTTRKFWNGAFFGGSLAAALAQGLMLGAFIKGVTVTDNAFSGGAFDWLSPFSILVAISVAIGYVLLGACWLILKTEGGLYKKARGWTRRLAVLVAVAFGAVSLATLSVDIGVSERWGFSMQEIDLPTLLPLLPLPLFGALFLFGLWRDLWLKTGENRPPDWRPYLMTAGVFLTGFIGLGVSVFPYIVPYEVTIWDAAARDNALLFLLVGAGVMIPVILMYTAFVYKLFWGKVKPGDGYHD